MPETEPRSKRLFRFGIFELETNSGELRKGGQTQPRLQEQPLQVLLLLLARPGEVVTREELRERLWSPDTFVDFDHGLNAAINKLRDALGDSASNPRFIQTLPRRGYRFIAPTQVAEVAGAYASEAESSSSQVAASNRVSRPGVSGLADAREASPQPSAPLILSDPRELPVLSRVTARVLFALIQVLYLSFYVASLAKLHRVEAVFAGASHPNGLLVLLITTAVAGLPTRLFLLTAAVLDYRQLDLKFQKLFPLLFLLDELWALAPFLIVHEIGFGLAMAATGALLFLPFAQRSLLLAGYRRAQTSDG